MESTPKALRYVGTFAAGIFAGSSFALNFGQLQALADHTVPPRTLVNQFRIWNGHQSGFQSVTALATIGITLGHSIYSAIRRLPLNYNFLFSGGIMTVLIPLSTAFLRPMIEPFYSLPDSEIGKHGLELRSSLHRYQTFQWLRILAGSAAFAVLLTEPF